ncbi:MAG TPA: GntR family transcriptional regulator [Gaiellales bacterium]|jgi:DNA-binding GntR family transcriptional regulator
MSANSDPASAPTAADEAGGRAFGIDVSSVLTPTSPVHLSDTVTERLRRTIVEGRFSPGDRLREEQLAEALDVSRGPIRDALRELEREGLVVRRRNRGAIVASLSREDVEEVYSLRAAIEPLVCEWAARRASERDWAEMQAVIERYSDLAATANPHEAADADLRFHDVIYRAAGHRRVQRLWQDLRPQVYIFLLARKYVGTHEFRDVMISKHSAILAAIEARDPERARQTAVDHVEASYTRVIADYDDVPLPV